MAEPIINPGGHRVFVLPKYEDADGRLTCPGCGCQDFRVENSYSWIFGKPRWRKCRNCGWRIRTKEVIDEPHATDGKTD